MPIAEISVARLGRLIGKNLPIQELQQILAEIGSDVEPESAGDTLKINLLPARPDLFDVAGLARALKGYLGFETGFKVYRFNDSGVTVRVEESIRAIRPYIAAAIVKGLSVDEQLLKELMEMQENLHWGLGRDRRRASIGIYDLATIQPDFIYQAVKPDGIKFIPLGGIPEKPDAPVTPAEILSLHPKGQAYRHLIKDFPAYPLLTDREGKILSLPPIINSEDTKLSPATKDLFIDITGPDEWAVKKCINILTAALADLGGEVQKVTIAYPDGERWQTPGMETQEISLELEDVVKVIGIPFTKEEVISLLKKMRYDAKMPTQESRLKVIVPAYRSDILHPWDIIEDIAIAYGYHRLPARPIPTVTTSRPLEIEEISQLCRSLLIGLGFIEIVTLCLTNPEAQFSKLGIEDNGLSVMIENPVSIEQTMLRRHLLTGLLETFSRNSTQPYPQNIFEIGDVFYLHSGAETSTIAQRHIAIGIADAKTGFSDIKSVIETLARELNFPIAFAPKEQPPFLLGRCAVLQNPKPIGIAGEVHPEILERFGLTVPVVLAEIDITYLVSP